MAGVVVRGSKFLLPRWGHLGHEARNAMPRVFREQRRAERVPVSMPVLLYGHSEGEPFQEQAETIDVSANGGLVPVETGVLRSQKLILTNLLTNQELACRVARIVRTREGKTLAGIEFLEPAAGFWGEYLHGPAANHSLPNRT
jgi:hypothetical protein